MDEKYIVGSYPPSDKKTTAGRLKDAYVFSTIMFYQEQEGGNDYPIIGIWNEDGELLCLQCEERFFD